MTEPYPVIPLSAPVGEPVAVIERAGRWTYRVYVQHDICRWGPDGYGWHVFGRKHAERKARKVLAKYLAQQEPERWEITS